MYYSEGHKSAVSFQALDLIFIFLVHFHYKISIYNWKVEHQPLNNRLNFVQILGSSF